MYDKRNSFNSDDVFALILKLLLFFGALMGAIITALKVYEKIQSNRMHSLCGCCDEYYDDDYCECECGCDCDEDKKDFAETVAEVTEKEINPTEN